VALNRNNRQKARSAFFGNNSGLETSKYSDSRAARIMKVHFRRFDKSFAFIGKIRRERG
jgi:hypothetical protein